MEAKIKMQVPGVVDRMLTEDTNCLNEVPGLQEAWAAGTLTKVGRGYRWTAHLTPEMHEHVVGYLDSKLDVEEVIAGGAGSDPDHSLIRGLRKVLGKT